MSILEKFLVDKRDEAILISEGAHLSRDKDDYIREASEGTIVAFRLNIQSNQGVDLTKVISGMVIENNTDEEVYAVETRNGLKYAVPHGCVTWVKTGDRWPKGVYEEMKKGAVVINKSDTTHLSQIDGDIEYDDEEYDDEDLEDVDEILDEDDEDYEDDEDEDDEDYDEEEYEDEDEEDLDELFEDEDEEEELPKAKKKKKKK